MIYKDKDCIKYINYFKIISQITDVLNKFVINDFEKFIIKLF